MKTISPAIETAEKIAGAQAYAPGKIYRRSSFRLEATCPEGLLLYHSLSGELLLLEGGETPESPALREALVKHWFLVPEEFDELRHCGQVKTVARLLRQETDNVNRYAVFTTTDCNARCFYCFEMGQRRFSMSEQTARDAAAYMLAHAGGEKLHIRWFGGEPLYNVGVIDVISQTLRERGAEYESVMFSNAYLFDAQKISRAKTLWRLRNVVVTLDGTEEVYNRTKAFVYREGSAYRRVLANIEALLDADIAVTVNLNMDAANAEDLFTLVDELGTRFGGREIFCARGELLAEYEGKISHFDSARQALDARAALNRKLKAYGIRERKTLGRGLKLNSCMADDPKHAVILPDGRVGRCEHYGDREEVGSIYGGIDAEKLAAWKEPRPVEEACRSCAFYPQCFRLKKCSAHAGKCTELFREQRLNDLRDKMRNTYEKWKREQGGN